MTGTSDIDTLIDFLFKMANSYLKELSNIDTKKLNKNIRDNLSIDAGLNMQKYF